MTFWDAFWEVLHKSPMVVGFAFALPAFWGWQLGDWLLHRMRGK